MLCSRTGTMSITTNEKGAEEAKKVMKHKAGFNRSPSIEKLFKFNAYICSQNFFFLPSLLMWLKSSQSLLRIYGGKCTNYVKSLAFLLLKTTRENLMIIATGLRNMPLSDPKKTLVAFRDLREKLNDSLMNIPEEVTRKLLEVAIYGSFLLIFLQLVACIVGLGVGSLPGGLIFLLVSLSWICYMNYQCLRLILVTEALKGQEKKCDNAATQRYIRPKDILGKRTISSLNLF